MTAVVVQAYLLAEDLKRELKESLKKLPGIRPISLKGKRISKEN